jgi:hypothetical protein
MNTNKKWRFAMMPVALAAVALIPLQGCDEIQNAQSSLCCSEFTPGADLAAVKWDLEGQGELRYGAFMQAVSDFTGSANAMVGDVENACTAIAVDLGASPSDVKETKPDARASAWCALAVAKITEIGGNLQINFQPPSCTVNVQAQASCEGRCGVKAECELTPGEIQARCDPGKLSVKCQAGCTGSCEGSANLAVECQGTCQGTCKGQCSMGCSAMGPGGSCDGSCAGTCDGECRGTCKVEAGATVNCAASCTGGCDGEFTAPKCTAELSPPKADCNVDAECNASCNASASAKAECREPSLEISGDANANALIATLKVNLPRLLLVAQARGKLLVDNAGAVFDASANIDVGGSVKATACLIPAAAAISQAVLNAEASLSASLSVMGAVNIK